MVLWGVNHKCGVRLPLGLMHLYHANINDLSNTHFCVGCFELYLRKIFTAAHKIGK